MEILSGLFKTEARKVTLEVVMFFDLKAQRNKKDDQITQDLEAIGEVSNVTTTNSVYEATVTTGMDRSEVEGLLSQIIDTYKPTNYYFA